MKEVVIAISKLSLFTQLVLLFFLSLGFWNVFLKFRRERSKRVTCIDIVDIKKIKVINRFYCFIPISYIANKIENVKIIKYMENERIVTIAGVISDEEITDMKEKTKILEFLEEKIKNKNIKINYRFKKNKDINFWRKLLNIFKTKDIKGIFRKILYILKSFWKMWFVKYEYYFDIYYKATDERYKKVKNLNSEMIMKFEVYTTDENFFQMRKYRKAKDFVDKQKKNPNEIKKERTDIDNENLKPMWTDEYKNEKLKD